MTFRSEGIGEGLGEVLPEVEPFEASKFALVRASLALHRAIASSHARTLLRGGTAGLHSLVIAIFEDALYYQRVAARYDAYGALGTSVLVGFPGAPQRPSARVRGFDVDGGPLEGAWVLVALSDVLTSVVVATALEGVGDGDTYEGARRFSCRWTFQREPALKAADELLALVRPEIPPDSLAPVDATLRHLQSRTPSAAEEALGTALENLLVQLGATGAPRHLQAGETDEPLGLPNLRYLARYLADARVPRTSRLVAVVLEVDDVEALGRHVGREFVASVLQQVAASLLRGRRTGEVVLHLDGARFLVVCPETAVAPRALAERFQEVVRRTELEPPFAATRLSASVRVTRLEGARVDLLALIGATVARPGEPGRLEAEEADR